MQKASMWLNLYGRQAVQRKLKKGLKTQKNALLTVNCPCVGQPDDQIGWATSMIFASIYDTNPRTNSWNFLLKKFKTWFENLFFFQLSILIFFIKKLFDIYDVARNFDDYPGLQ